MADEGISPEVKQFIRQFIQSIEQLEILLLVRSHPSREWTPKAVFDVVRSSEWSVTYRLAEFAERGLMVANGSTPPSYRYRPKSSDMDRLVEETAKAYQQRRVVVIETIFKPEADAAQSFADAFRFKKQ